MDKDSRLMGIFPTGLREIVGKLPVSLNRLQEIRLRVNGPLTVLYDNREHMIGPDGQPVPESVRAYRLSEKEIRETITFVSNYSLYAYEEEIRQGFITIQGGHRVGVAGKIIWENGSIRSIRYISFINIRLAHQVKGCASRVLPYLYDGGRLCHTLILSPPGGGKTTILRDIIRQVSDGTGDHPGCNVGVVDERSELAACYMGVPQNDLGIRTDVLDGCPKAEGMLLMLRSMAPQVIAVDEIGSRADIDAIEYVINCGCTLLATVHGNSFDDLKRRPVLGRLTQEKIFERYMILGNRRNAGNVEAVLNADGNCLYQNHRGSLCH